MTEDVSARPANRRGRPPGTSARELEVAALRLFSEQGFHETTVDQIAAAAGVSRRTFFRYYDAKADVLWNEFDSEVEAIRDLLADLPDDLPVPEAGRPAGLAATLADDVLAAEPDPVPGGGAAADRVNVT